MEMHKLTPEMRERLEYLVEAGIAVKEGNTYRIEVRTLILSEGMKEFYYSKIPPRYLH